MGITKKVLVAVRSSTGEYWDGYSNSRLDSTQRIQISSDMVPYAGIMIIKLIDSSDELLAERNGHGKKISIHVGPCSSRFL